MISFIIPIIHPSHKSITTYHDILSCLKNTLGSLLKQPGKKNIIVVAHLIPNWFKSYFKSVHFIIVNSKLFDILKDLDSIETKDLNNEMSLYEIPAKYKKYLNMRGAFHNKDKGLKYLIGLLYYFNLADNKKTKFIYLMDGDDFISKDLKKVLEKSPPHTDVFFVEHGYLMVSNSLPTIKDRLKIDKIYSLDDFTNVCGSNRIFRAKSLEVKLNRRLRFKIPSNTINQLMYQRTVTNNLVDIIMSHLNEKPGSWSILANFLGIHRLYVSDNLEYSHPFLKLFKIGKIPIRAAIKFIHTANHSCHNNSHDEIQNDIIDRYIKSGLIPKNNLSDHQVNETITKFAINSFLK